MKQTAVEWFAKELNNWRIKEFGEDSIIGIPQEVFELAKAMEKQQIKDAWINSLTKGDYNSAEEYYNETFKQNKMKPKEKAKDLFNRFSNLKTDYEYCVTYQTTKEISLIAVDEILDVIAFNKYDDKYWEEEDYWQEVKKEITNL